MSASCDKTIKLYNINKEECEYTFSGHSEKIFRAIALIDENYFISGANDKNIIIWDYNKKILYKKYICEDYIG